MADHAADDCGLACSIADRIRVVRPRMMGGIDGMAFDQFTDVGKFWSATIAALVLLMIVGAERDSGRVTFFAAVGEFARRSLWIGAAVMVLGLVYLGLGLGQ